MGRLVKNPRIVDSVTESVVLSTGTTALRPAEPTVGAVRYNTQLSAFETFNGSVWRVATAQGLVTVSKSVTIGDGVETVYSFASMTPAFILPVGYASESDVKVFVGGVYQEPTQNYTIDNGLGTITFGNAPGLGVRVVLLAGENSTQLS